MAILQHGQNVCGRERSQTPTPAAPTTTPSPASYAGAPRAACPSAQVRSPLVAAYLEELGQSLATPSVKPHLAALKHCFDALVMGRVLLASPAHAVRGPR